MFACALHLCVLEVVPLVKQPNPICESSLRIYILPRNRKLELSDGKKKIGGNGKEMTSGKRCREEEEGGEEMMVKEESVFFFPMLANGFPVQRHEFHCFLLNFMVTPTTKGCYEKKAKV